MGKSKHDWYQDAVHIIRRYPKLLERKRRNEQSITSNYSGVSRPHCASRITEQIATQRLSDVDEAEYTAVERAIDKINYLAYSKEILAIIDLVDWGRDKITIADAAVKCNMSDKTARRYRKIFILAVARECGWIC